MAHSHQELGEEGQHPLQLLCLNGHGAHLHPAQTHLSLWAAMGAHMRMTFSPFPGFETEFHSRSCWTGAVETRDALSA